MNLKISPALFAAISIFFLSASATFADSISGRVVHANVYELSVGVDGIVDGIAAREGERVLAGTQLLSLENSVFDADIAAATTSLSLIKEELVESKRSFERDQALYDEGSLSTVELDLARIEMLRQQSRVAAVNAAVADAKQKKAMAQIIAPEAGMVVRLNAAKGQRINVSAQHAPLLVFVGNAVKVVSRITYSIDASESTLTPGASVTIEF